MIIQHRPNILIIKDILYKSLVRIIHISNINRLCVFDYIIKIKLGFKYYITKRYYNYTLSRFIQKINKYKCFNKENNLNILFTYVIIKSNR